MKTFTPTQKLINIAEPTKRRERKNSAELITFTDRQQQYLRQSKQGKPL